MVKYGFYKRILFPNVNYNIWSSSETTLPEGVTKEDFDKKSVLERFDHQLKTSGLTTKNTMKPNFSWACSNIDKIKKGDGQNGSVSDPDKIISFKSL